MKTAGSRHSLVQGQFSDYLATIGLAAILAFAGLACTSASIEGTGSTGGTGDQGGTNGGGGGKGGTNGGGVTKTTVAWPGLASRPENSRRISGDIFIALTMDRSRRRHT